MTANLTAFSAWSRPLLPMDSKETDPNALLNFDEAAVPFIAATKNDDTFQRLKVFARRMTYYIGLAEQTNAANNGDSEEGAEEEEEPPQQRTVGRASAAQRTAAARAMAPQNSRRKRRHNEVDEEVSAAAAAAPAGAAAPPQQQRRCQDGATETDVDEGHLQVAARKAVDLESSSLRHSVGRTRKMLNRHLERKFGSAGVATDDDNQVSHLILHDTCGGLPANMNQTLRWWLQDGKKQLEQASLLISSQHAQPKEGFPIFWACPQKGQSEKLFYIGHFQCIRFKKCNLTVKNKPRQALIEFRFVKFDETLASMIAHVPERTVNDKRSAYETRSRTH